MIVNSKRDLLKTLFFTSGLGLMTGVSGAAVSSSSLNNDGFIRWEILQGTELKSLRGQSFLIYGIEASCSVKLRSVHLGKLDPNLPKNLIRRQGFVAQFYPEENFECLQGDQIVKITHPAVLGNAQVFAVKKEDNFERIFYEVVFN